MGSPSKRISLRGRFSQSALASQAAAGIVALVAVLVVAAGVLAAAEARSEGMDAARDKVTGIAVSLADSPSTAEALAGPSPSSALQPVTERVRRAAGVDFITIMSPDGIRYTHTYPEKIGQRYIGTTEGALRGEITTEVYVGTLGATERAIAPVRDADGRIVGMVAVGVTIEGLTRSWIGRSAAIALVGLLALAAAAAGGWWIRRRILRATGGLPPRDLRLMYEHHDAVLHAIREGVIVVSGGRPVLLNDEARRLLGGDDGKGIGDGVAPEIPAVAGEFLAGADEPMRDVLVAHGGRVLLANSARFDAGGTRSSAVITLRDQTELSAALGELDALRQFSEALRSQAHESANRLHTVVALYEMGRGEEAARIATADLAPAQELVDRLGETIDEPALVALLLGKAAQASERGIELGVTEESSYDPPGPLGAAELVTVLGNLVDNALDACDPEDPWVEVTVADSPDELGIVVADSGPGLDSAEFERAQERGFSTKAGGDAAGRGLGLALVAQVVRRHGGSLRAERTYGSVVEARIPRSREDGSSESEVQPR